MSMTQESTAKRAPNGEQRRSQDLTIDLRLFRVLHYICRSMYKQWAVVKQLIDTGDAKGADLCTLDQSLLWVEAEIYELESLLGREELGSEDLKLWKSLLRELGRK